MESTDNGLSPWFGGNQKPWEPGVYEVRLIRGTAVRYANWNGEFWSFMASSSDHARAFASLRSIWLKVEEFQWRGIGTPPVLTMRTLTPAEREALAAAFRDSAAATGRIEIEPDGAVHVTGDATITCNLGAPPGQPAQRGSGGGAGSACTQMAVGSRSADVAGARLVEQYGPPSRETVDFLLRHVAADRPHPPHRLTTGTGIGPRWITETLDEAIARVPALAPFRKGDIERTLPMVMNLVDTRRGYMLLQVMLRTREPAIFIFRRTQVAA
jgi:hypothetical protein